MRILNAKDFEFDFEQRNERLRAIEQVITEGDYSDEEKEWFRTQCTYDVDPAGWMELHDWCYVCGEKLIVPCIFWHGSPRSREMENRDRYQIWLHASCAVYLAEKFRMTSKNSGRTVTTECPLQKKCPFVKTGTKN
jgi:hypothetical protein